MARDEAARGTTESNQMAREQDTDDSLLGRRSYLKMAGAAAASVAAGAAASGSADAASYDTIKIPAGTRKVIRVGPGETFENKLIDISADGAHVKLMTEGSGWTVRNVGVKGKNNHRSGTFGTFYLRCTDGGEALAENIYLGDGAANRVGHAAVSGYGNSGHVTIRNVHVQGWSADGMYLSQPGVPGNSGGTFTVEKCFAKNNNIENIRIGTTGSEIRDCVVHVEGKDAVTTNESGQKNPRGIWFKEQTGLKAINCDVKVRGADAVAGYGRGGAGTLVDCRVDGRIRGDVTKQNVSGNPDLTPPSGVPMTPEEAASGQTSSSDSSTDTTTSPDSTDDSTSDQQGTLLELVADQGVMAEYEFTVEGSASKATSNVAHPADTNDADAVTDNGDGTVTVSGIAGNGHGDSYYVDGVVTSMTLDESKWTLTYDGSQVSPSDITYPNKLIIDGSGSPNAMSSYRFTVSGGARKSESLGSVNGYDEIASGEITGRVVGGKDGYRFSGEITGFSLEGPASVRVEDGS